MRVRSLFRRMFVAEGLSSVCVGLFLTSTMFPITAGVYPAATVPRWLGLADACVAGLLLASAIVLAIRNQSRISDHDRLTSFRIAQYLNSGIPALLVMFFIAGRRIHWDVLVVGLAWRGWLLLYTLPFLIAAQRSGLRLRSK